MFKPTKLFIGALVAVFVAAREFEIYLELNPGDPGAEGLRQEIMKLRGAK